MSELTLPQTVTIHHRASVDRGVDIVWPLLNGFFDLGLFLDVSCKDVNGTSAIGAIRQIGDAILEVMVGATRHSYSYAQVHAPMSAHAYHGCVACETNDSGGTEILYTLAFDQSGIEPEKR